MRIVNLKMTDRIISHNSNDSNPRSGNGYIALWRDIEKQPWYKNHEQKAVFIHLLLKAAYKPCTIAFKGVQVNILQGQCVTSLNELSRELNISLDKVRRAIESFKKLGQVSTVLVGSGTNKRTVYTLRNWVKFQSNSSENDHTLTATQNHTQNHTPNTAEIKGLDGNDHTQNHTQNHTLTATHNNNKEIKDINGVSETRQKGFEIFWSQWRKFKRELHPMAKQPEGQKAKAREKFNKHFTEQRIAKSGVESFKQEISSMCDFINEVKDDLMNHNGSLYFQYRNMYPQKFISLEQWKDGGEA